MATTVDNAFDQFLTDTVRIASNRSEIAKSSKENLVREIIKFPSDGLFPVLYPGMESIDYGSFSRKTKIRPLDDIDIMIVLHAQGNSRTTYNNSFQITVPDTATQQLPLCNPGTYTLNSTKVLNRFKAYLSKVPDYKNADIKKNGEAATLTLDSYEWTFDLVPCFQTTPDYTGKTFFLIPDGAGNWKATDPRIDKERTQKVNNAQKVSVLDMVRLMKYWTRRPTMPTINSYFLENLILDYYGYTSKGTQWVDRELADIFAYIYNNIEKGLTDPKGFQGDINNLTDDERQKVKERARVDYHKAKEAIDFETEDKMKESVGKWGEIFGDKFPIFG
jgi:hypothetical protein